MGKEDVRNCGEFQIVYGGQVVLGAGGTRVRTRMLLIRFLMTVMMINDDDSSGYFSSFLYAGGMEGERYSKVR